MYSNASNVGLYLRKQNVCPLEAADQLGLFTKIIITGTLQSL